jgi:hypothetical protein
VRLPRQIGKRTRFLQNRELPDRGFSPLRREIVLLENSSSRTRADMWCTALRPHTEYSMDMICAAQMSKANRALAEDRIGVPVLFYSWLKVQKRELSSTMNDNTMAD